MCFLETWFIHMLLHAVISETDRAMADSRPSLKDTRLLFYSFISKCLTVKLLAGEKVSESADTFSDDEGIDKELL